MPWMIMSDDDLSLHYLREDAEMMKAHTDWEESIKEKILAAGSLRDDDGTHPTGGLLILDVESKAEAEAIVQADPFTQAGLRTNLVMRYWYKSILAGQVYF